MVEEKLRSLFSFQRALILFIIFFTVLLIKNIDVDIQNLEAEDVLLMPKLWVLKHNECLITKDGQCQFWFVRIDYDFIKGKLWPEVLKITKADPNLKLPQISPCLSHKTDAANYTYEEKRIRLFRERIYNDAINFAQINHQRFKFNDLLTLYYMDTGHELLHYVYHMQGRYTLHHYLMYKKADLAKIYRFVENHFKAPSYIRSERLAINKIVANEEWEDYSKNLNKKTPDR